MLRPLAYRDPQPLVSIARLNRSDGMSPLPVCAAHFAEWRRSSTSFDGLSILEGSTFTLIGRGEPARLASARVSANLFTTLGATMQMGRSFLPEEDAPGRDVVILSHELWRQQFQSDPHVIGRTIASNGASYAVVGVLPADFHFPVISHWSAR